ncbi:F-box protein At3g07870-like [Coffea arabica]|uniref:F-box protein At3g07870-like n=1 Tax=Coffea arabica TaxID=13443 RepID=A0A6P6UJI2_COFAR|nr:F-box protein At3g07870-like [Coffea arabica]
MILLCSRDKIRATTERSGGELYVHVRFCQWIDFPSKIRVPDSGYSLHMESGYAGVHHCSECWSSKAGEYKVVRIYQEVLEENLMHVIRSDCHVYTLGSERRWRYTGHAPFLYTCREHGVFLNGNLHWWIRDPDGKEFISCFDLDKESFQHFPAPPELDELNLASLELYQDRLSVCDNTSDFDIVIWVMKEYGLKKSWFKQFVIDKHPIDLVGQYYEVVRILKVFRDGEIWLIWRDDLLISFNSKTNSLQRIDTNRFLCGSDQ